MVDYGDVCSGRLAQGADEVGGVGDGAGNDLLQGGATALSERGAAIDNKPVQIEYRTPA